MSPTAIAPLARRLRAELGLRRIAAHERLGEPEARRLTAPVRRLAIARARRRVAPLRRWEGIPERTFARQAVGGNAVRIARVRDLVPARSRVLDVGMGHGYVAGVLLRDRAPARYCGVELRQARIDAVEEMLAANGLGERRVELLAADVLEVEPGFWHRNDPDVVLLLEVLEHLDDPQRLLRAVAGSLRAGARVLLTVPLRGRLEWVWGHRSIFDRRRIERLCRAAGLEIERAEPVQSTWALVLARATGSSGTASGAEPDPTRTFTRAPVGGGGRPDGSVRLPIPSPEVVRLDLSVDPAPGASTLVITGRDETEASVLGWAGPPASGRATYVLRPGRRSRALRPSRAGDPGRVRWVDVAIESEWGGGVGPTVHRAAYAGGPPPRQR